MAPVKKVKTGKAARYLTLRDPKSVEDTKMTLMLKGTRAGPKSGSALQALSHILSPHVKVLTRKNPNALPFDDASSIEFLMDKNNCALFAVASHSKKRPDNLVIGRGFDGRLLDMVEFHVESVQTAAEVSTTCSKRMGSKPALLFVGSEWECDAVLRPVRNILLDLFRGDDVSSVLLAGLDHVIVCAAVDGKIKILPHAVQLRRSGAQVPRVDLSPMGPTMVLSHRRHTFPAPDLLALSCRQPKQLTAKSIKNIKTNEFGDRMGQVHIQKQNLDELQIRKRKAFRSLRDEDTNDKSGEVPGDAPSGSKRRRNNDD